ncbi:uncharacterized protein BP5553_10413 [Venustampulla echinocandica]|uniref:Uncharacterized protein n=1 Tax=Venustampulla echinocandica TaxID=2656787 RepID=A0A370T988_9HELO|nr:uncharacterized protein BP5553_10413 [Venustampulla echinocandica]RDL30135.1 hypothetical protein BP5553_10413 [Venustampulla echinocandica]
MSVLMKWASCPITALAGPQDSAPPPAYPWSAGIASADHSTKNPNCWSSATTGAAYSGTTELKRIRPSV